MLNKKSYVSYISILTLIFLLNFATPPLALAKRSPPPDGKYSSSALQVVLEKVKTEATLGKKPVVVFDLDETLINSRVRGLRILNDLLSTLSMSKKYPKAHQLLANITADEKNLSHKAHKIQSYPYGDEMLKELGIGDPILLQEIKVSYSDLYMSNAYCARDLPLPGAVAYVKKIYAAGAEIIYLTGRNSPGMGICTEEALSRIGFPTPSKPNVTLMMKPNREMDDLAFKTSAIQEILKKGTVVGGFENEPANINLFKRSFPDAVCIFVDSTHSDKPESPAPGVFYIKDFLFWR